MLIPLLAFSLLGVLSSTNAHMILNTPIPYGKATLNNSPLNNAAPGSAGSDFPCKQRHGVYDITQVNTYPVGSSQELSFTGSATHGGGSCQISVSLDKEPTSNSQWKVIHSIIGGCPLSPFNFTVPAGLPNGQYTLAWTWFNRVGNREMYMNCAPVEVTGGADDLKVFNSLPDMFVANLPNTICASPDSQDLVFPSPGESVQTVFSTALGTVLVDRSSSGGCAAMTKLGAGAGSATLPGGGVSAPTTAPVGYNSASSAVVLSASTSTSASTTKSVLPSQAFTLSAGPTLSSIVLPVLTSSVSSLALSAAQSPSTTIPFSSAVSATRSFPYYWNSTYSRNTSSIATSYHPTTIISNTTTSYFPYYKNSTYSRNNSSVLASYQPTTIITVTTSSSIFMTYGTPIQTPGPVASPIPLCSNTTSSARAGTSTCSTDGALLCNGPSQFGLCDHGSVVWQPVAAGTVCEGGKIGRRGVRGVWGRV